MRSRLRAVRLEADFAAIYNTCFSSFFVSLNFGCYVQHFGAFERSRLCAVSLKQELIAIYNTLCPEGRSRLGAACLNTEFIIIYNTFCPPLSKPCSRLSGVFMFLQTRALA